MDPMPVVLTPVLDGHLNWVGLRLEGKPGEPLPAPVVLGLAERWQAANPSLSPYFFLPFDASWSDFSAFPAERMVFLLPSRPEPGGELDGACQALRSQGVHVAAPGLPDSPRPESADFAVLAAGPARQALSAEVLFQTLQNQLKLLAVEADSGELFEWCAANGFRFIHCHTLAYRPAPKGQAPAASRLLLVKLLGLVTQDAETTELEQVFKQEPKLAFDLLRLVNSASMGLQTKISSFRQAIAILGRRQLRRWLQLLMFAPQKEGAVGQGVLMQQAAIRGRLVELLSAETLAGMSLDKREQAFMAGLFSMLDVLMGVPMAELLKSLRLVDEVEQALLHREGDLGRLLVLAEQVEARDMEGLAASLQRLGISDSAFNNAQVATLAWVYRLGVSGNP